MTLLNHAQEDALGDVRAEGQTVAELSCLFRLPDAEFEDLMYERRFEKQYSSSPAAMSESAEVHGSTAEPEEEGKRTLQRTGIRKANNLRTALFSNCPSRKVARP